MSFTFTGNTPGYSNFVFEMKRSAADYRNASWFGLLGKGAAVCSDNAANEPVQFIVISLGGLGRICGDHDRATSRHGCRPHRLE